MTPLPCRYCGRPSWLADETGPAHPCCRWWFEREGAPHCPACRTSEALRRRTEDYRLEAPTTFRRFQPSSPHNPAREPVRIAVHQARAACDLAVTSAVSRASDQDRYARSGTDDHARQP